MAAYISLLDLQRVMHRALKRSGLPVWYTKGFNPHIYLAFSCPLALGQESLCESCEVKTEVEDPDYIRSCPHTTRVTRLDEVGAARNPVLHYQFPEDAHD